MKRRAVSILLCLSVALSLLPSAALAAGAHSIALSSATQSSALGSVTLQTTSAEANDTISFTISVTDPESSDVASVDVRNANGAVTSEPITVTHDKASGQCFFTMPDYDVVIDVLFFQRLSTMTLIDDDPQPLVVGYASAPALAVTGAPEGASYIWYAGADVTDKSAIIGGADGSSYTVPLGLDSGTHKYTVTVSATNHAGAQHTFTVVVSPAIATVTVGTIAPATGSEAYTAPVTIGSDAPIDVQVTVGTDTSVPSAGLSWPLGGASMDILVSGAESGTALNASVATPGASSYIVDDTLSSALLAALDGAAAVANAVCSNASTAGNFSTPAAPALSFAAPASEANVSVTLDDSLVAGGAARGLTITAQTEENSISLSGEALGDAAARYAGRDIVMGVTQDGSIGAGDFSGAAGAEVISGSGAQFTLEAVDPGGTNIPVSAPGGVDIKVTLPTGTDTGEFEHTGGLLHETGGGGTGGGTTEVLPTSIDSSYAEAAMDISDFGFIKVGGKWHRSDDWSAGIVRQRGTTTGEIRWFYCDADGYVRRGWVSGGALQQTPPTKEQLSGGDVWYYIRADGIPTEGPAVVGGQAYFFTQGAINANRKSFHGGSYFMTNELGQLKPGLMQYTSSIRVYTMADLSLFFGRGWYEIDGTYYYFVNECITGEQAEKPHSFGTIPEARAAYANISSCSPVAAALFSCEDAADTSWYNTSDNSFTINTAAQLAGLAALVNNNDSAIRDTFKGKTITLGSDIDLSGANWTPIGKQEGFSFKGEFDGNSKTISNLSISSAPSARAALFGECDGATIKNLTVGGRIATDGGSATTNNRYIAGIVAHAKKTHIESCTSTVEIDVTGSGNDLAYFVGGIAGHMEGAYLKTIVGCANAGNITIDLTTGNSACAGGLVGYLFNDRVYNSSNTGNVSVTGTVSLTGASASCAGGVAGAVTQQNGIAYIANCFSVANVTVGTDPGGPVVGENNVGGSRVLNSYGYSRDSGSYFNAGVTAATASLAELKALRDTLNQWVASPTLRLGEGETPFAGWHTSARYYGGLPCFMSYVAPPAPSGTSGRYYTLTLSANGGRTTSSLTRAEGTTIDLTDPLYIPVRDGYSFTGWYADAGLTNKLTSIRLTRDTTLYAGWEYGVSRLLPPKTGDRPIGALLLFAALSALSAVGLCALGRTWRLRQALAAKAASKLH